MKTKLIFFGLLCFNLSFGQNRSVGSVVPFDPAPSPNAPVATEIFRFRPGLVTQIQSGTGFGFGSTNRWFALGNITQGQDFYGLRLQSFERGLTLGYTNASPNNPRIEWIGNGANTGNLEFRVGTSFGTPGSPGSNLLVASMLSDGKIIVGDFFEPSSTSTRVLINNSAIGFSEAIALEANAGNADISSIGVKGTALTLTPFSAGIFGAALPDANQWAGFFDGRVFGTNFNRPSDERLKVGIAPADNNLQRIAQTQTVTYNYIKTDKLNLDAGLQHGFIAQAIEKIWPELVTEVNKPVFGKDGKVSEMFKFKTIDYMGMIAILAGGIKELNSKVEVLEKIIAAKSDTTIVRLAPETTTENTSGAFINQNIPNPFSDQTTISYQLPEGTNAAEIMIFDLNGRLIKSYPINKNQSELTIKASEIGSGLFIYSLVQNGQELLSKKMVVR